MGVLGGNRFFSADYGTARHRLRAEASRRGDPLTTLPLPSDGPDGQALTIDVVWRGPQQAERVVVVSSATHGVEGFFGAAVQLALLTEPPTLPDDVALVMIHAINPYGFAWLRRVNEDNIDLNRNFLLEGERYEGAPEGYAALDALLNPTRPPGALSHLTFPLQALPKIATQGMATLKGIVAGGQYTHPKGLFYGGDAPSASMRALQRFVPERFGAARHLLQVDFHTGLGAPATYKLLCDRSADSERFRWLRERFGEPVQPWDSGDQGVAYAIRGGLGTWMQATLPQAEVDVLAAEFGTVPALKVITALQLENRAHHWGRPGDAGTIRAKRLLLEAFAPSDAGWRDAVVDQGVRIVEQALAAV